jgi:hypothetical protein
MKTVYDEKGKAFGPFGTVTEEADGLLCDGKVMLPFDVLGEFFDIEDGAPPRVFSEDELQPMRDAKNAEINASRLKANTTTFAYSGKVFACDALSRGDIEGTNGCVLLTGGFPPGWPGAWKAVDNTYLPIATVNDWKAFYLAMCATGAANFAKSQSLKNQLTAAKTPETIGAIAW